MTVRLALGLAKNGHQLYTLFGLANVLIGARRTTV